MSSAKTQRAGGPGKVYLVGAGPGDPDLITVRGLQLVNGCDALVYDNLVPSELVSHSPAADKIYVGKTEGGHSMAQGEITELLVDLATREGGPRSIVRLKGGDPYVFGRGGEEALACVRAGVPFEVVPGVTAGVAAPAYAGVPVTHRQVSRGVTFVTGHLAHGNLEHLPWQEMARSGFTLVFYMGVATLPEIAGRLMEHGLAGETPATVVQEGTTPGQRSVCGPVAEIAEKAREVGIRAPAVTVVGEVAALAGELGLQVPRPLAGKTVVLLKAEESAYEELELLRQEGARVIEVSIVRGMAAAPVDELAGALGEIDTGDAVFFSSATAVRFFAPAWSRLGARSQPLFTATGPTVVEALQHHALDVAAAPGSPGERGVQAAADCLAAVGVSQGATVWLPRSGSAGPRLAEGLTRAGFGVRPVTVYRTVPVPVPADVRSILRGGRVDAVLFLSGSCVEAALAAAPELAGEQGKNVLFGAIGALTERSARQKGIVCQVVPERPRVIDLIEMIITDLGNR